MKTKKVLALVVLAAFLISIVPFAAFAAPAPGKPFNTNASTVKAPEGSVEAQKVTDAAGNNIAEKQDGAEFTVILNDPLTLRSGTLHIASSRPSVDYLIYKDINGDWQSAGTFESLGGVYTYNYTISGTQYSKDIDFKIVSTVAGTSNIVFGDNTNQAVQNYVQGKAFDTNNATGDINDIIQQKKFPVEFTDAKADGLTIQLDGYTFDAIPANYPNAGQYLPAGQTVASFVDGNGVSHPAYTSQTSFPANVSGPKPANGVDTYKVQAIVTSNNIPVAGKDVSFTVVKGNGLSLTAAKAATDVTGKAEVKVYATRATGTEPAEIQARVSGIPTNSTLHNVKVVFGTPGITSIKAESDNNQKVARDAGNFTLKFSAYDASGNRVTISADQLNDMTRTVVAKPSGSGISDKEHNTNKNTDSSLNFRLATRNDGDASIIIDTNDLKKDGDYEVKVYLTNGSTVSYKFNAKEQGEVVKMELSYASDSYSGNTRLPRPEIKYYDAEGYKVTKEFGTALPSSAGGAITQNDVKLSISDASFIAANDSLNQADGRFTLRDDKSGVITMTAVDTTKNLVATQVLNIQKVASYLKLTPQSVGAVGGVVTVDIELVDVDGKLAATGFAAASSGTSATVIAKPEGAIASADSVNINDFAKGKASVKVSSNMEGDITLQVIITDTATVVNASGATVAAPKVYTGACTVSFGKASAGGGQLIFIIGAPSFVSGNQVHAAESPSFIDNGRTFLGVRDMATAMGAIADWDQASQTATLSKDGIIIKVTVGADKIAVTKNGVTSEVPSLAAAQNKNGRVYLPFRAVLEAFNYTVTYDQATNSIVCAL